MGYEDPEKRRARTRKWNAANPDKKKDMNLRRRYNITLHKYNEMLTDQGGVCKVCRGDNDGGPLHVDHNHDTGDIRGLLCFTCNSHLVAAFDKFRDNLEEVLQSARKYLGVSNAV